MTELCRVLATFAERPTERTAALADLLGLAALPTDSDYTELFIVQQPPYASAYLNPDGSLGGEAQDRVAGFWRALGVTVSAEPDHLATMLAGYARLDELARIEGDGRRGEALRRACDAFLWEHLLSWVPAYSLAAERHAAPAYAAWARLLLDVLLERAAASIAPGALPLHLRDVPPIPDPRLGDVLGFLCALSAPARSGIILTRADLVRAGQTLLVSVRATDVHLAVRGLIEHDPAGALAWLSDEAQRWNELHSRLVPVTGQLAQFWVERTATTRALLRSLHQDLAGPEMRRVMERTT